MDSSQGELIQARHYLRDLQQNAAIGLPGFPYQDLENVLPQALDALEKRTDFVSTEDPERVRRDFFSFRRSLEERRIQIARDLIIRTEPGPFEDPGYLAMMAYQAASVEMGMAMLKNDAQPLSKFLLGTVHKPTVNAFAETVRSSGYTNVVLHSALIDFIYQAVKVVVEAQQPVGSKNPDSTVSVDPSPERIGEIIQENTASRDRLYKTLESYFYYGYPRALANEIPAREHQPMISICVAMAERWVIAHEYGHGFFDGKIERDKVNNPLWVEEFLADSNATILTVFSAAQLDGLPPEHALSGASFSLACLEILRQAYSIVKTGTALKDEGTETHPPNTVRAARTVEVFKQFFDVRYFGRRFDLEFVLRDSIPDLHAFRHEHSRRVHQNSEVLFQVWKHVKKLLEEQFRLQRPLHHLWK